jgi:hypothetical protein
LLSLWRWSDFPVEIAVLFGPGLIAFVFMSFLFDYIFLFCCMRWESLCRDVFFKILSLLIYPSTKS